MKKTTIILAVTLVIAGLVIITAASILATETTTTNASSTGGFIQRFMRLLTGEIINDDISENADVNPDKIYGTAWTGENDGSSSGLDADKLDDIDSSQFLRNDMSGTISGDLSVDGDLTWQTKTSYISISPAAFRPARDWYEFMCNGISLRNIDGSSDTYYAPLELPHGSKITNITWYWYDSSSADGSLWIYRSDFDTTLHPIGSCFSSGSSGDGSSYDNSVSQPWIDNSQYHYWLSVSLEDSDIYCYGAAIEYTFTKLY
jgi:uncharacterized membrane protein